MRLKTLASRVTYRINRKKNNVFILADFSDLSDRDQVGRVLRKLVKAGDLVKIGYGLYAKARYSEFSNRYIPIKALPSLAKEALKKLGVETYPTIFENQYNEYKSTQVPTGRVIGVKDRVSRKINFDSWEIAYERTP